MKTAFPSLAATAGFVPHRIFDWDALAFCLRAGMPVAGRTYAGLQLLEWADPTTKEAWLLIEHGRVAPTMLLDVKAVRRLRHAETFLRAHAREERAFARDLARAFTRAGSQVLRELLATMPEGISPSPTSGELAAAGVRWAQLAKKEAAPHVRRIVKVGAAMELRRFLPKSRKASAFMELPPVVERAAERHAEVILDKPYWRDVAESVREEIAGTIERSLKEGASNSQIASRLRDVLGESGSRKRGMLIARTETTGAMNAGQFATMQQLAKQGIVRGRQWFSTLDEKTRDSHFDVHLQTVEVDEPFVVGGEECMYPGDPDLSAEERCNCILPGAMVQGQIEAASRSWYAGKSVEVVTRAGRRLSLTPNHPVLTPCGFVAAGRLQGGDKLIAYDSQVDLAAGGAASGDKQNDVPVCIEDVFQALMQRAVSGRGASIREFASGREDHFHGDAVFCQGKIEVVSLDRPLADDGSAVHATPLGQFCIGPAANLDVRFSESAKQQGAAVPGLIGQLFERYPGEVAVDEIVEIRDGFFSGYVFDLQTRAGVIVANDILISNCRCTTMALTPADPEAEDLGQEIDDEYDTDEPLTEPEPQPADDDDDDDGPAPLTDEDLSDLIEDYLDDERLTMHGRDILERFGLTIEDLDRIAGKGFDPDQPRDELGRWSSGASGGGSAPANKEEAAAWAEKNLPGWKDSLSEEENGAIEKWSGAGYANINTALREGDRFPLVREAEADNIVRLDSALSKGETQAEVTAQRFAYLPELASTAKVGDQFTDKGFVSTTLDPKFGASMGNNDLPGRVLMDIKVPVGSKAGWISERGQSELLLPRNSRFAITGIESQANGSNRWKVEYLGTSESSGGKSAKYRAANDDLLIDRLDQADRFVWRESHIVVMSAGKGFDQPRDGGGRYALSGAFTGGTIPETAAELHQQAELRRGAWLELEGILSPAVLQSAQEFTGKAYRQLEARYGRPWAVGVLAAGVIGLPLPMPGAVNGAAPVIVGAELHRYYGPGQKGSLILSTLWAEAKEFWIDLLDGWRKAGKKDFDPNQERDETGKWTSTGAGGGSGDKPAADGGGDKPAAGAKPMGEKAKAMYDKTAAGAKERGEASLNQLTEKWGGPKDPAEVRAKLQEAWDKVELTVNIDERTMGAALAASGSLKNVYEVNAESGRETDPRGVSLQARTDQEADVLGVDKDSAPGDRPVYAAANWQENLNGAAGQYGDGGASLVLNKEAFAGQMTVTPRDSFGMTGWGRNRTGTDSDPMAALAQDGHALEAAGYSREQIAGSEGEAIYKGISRGYTEVQVWGGAQPLNKDTVKEIRIPASRTGSAGAQSLKDFSDKTGIPLRVYDDKTGKSVDFDTARTAATASTGGGGGILGAIGRLFGGKKDFDPNQERDETGKWSSTGGGGGSGDKPAGGKPDNDPAAKAQAERVAKLKERLSRHADPEGVKQVAAMKQIAKDRRTVQKEREKIHAGLDKLQAKITAMERNPDGSPKDPKEAKEVLRQWDEAQSKLDSLGQEMKAAERAAVDEALAVKNPAEQNVFLAGENKEDITEAVTESTGFLKGKIAAAVTPDGAGGALNIVAQQIPITEPQRAYHDRQGAHIGLLDGGETVTHEIGHLLEENPRVRQLAQDFRAMRVGDEEPQALSGLFPKSGYGMSEKGAADDFSKANAGFDHREQERRAYYTGKIYPGGETEIMSMGLEHLHRDPVGFAARDPEYFRFVTGVISGRLLKK